MIEKRAEWEMQRQDAVVAKENALYSKIQRNSSKGPFKIPVQATPQNVEATKIELLTKCLLEGIDYKTILNHSLASEGNSSKKVTLMKSTHTAHSSPLPTAKKAHLHKSGSSSNRYNCNYTGGSSETKLRKSATGNTHTPDAAETTNVYNSSINDRSSMNFDNIANISYNNYQPVNRIKRELEHERRAIVGKKIDSAAATGYSQMTASTTAATIKNKSFNYSAKKLATPSKVTSSPAKMSTVARKA